MDTHGHIRIPEELKEYAGLDGEILLVGQGNYMEIWSPQLWNEQEAQLKDASANASRFSALMLATH